MDFTDFSNISEKMNALGNRNILFYTKNGVITDNLPTCGYAILPLPTMKRLRGIYAQAYHSYVRESCGDCREHKLIQLEIELSRLYEELDEEN